MKSKDGGKMLNSTNDFSNKKKNNSCREFEKVVLSPQSSLYSNPNNKNITKFQTIWKQTLATLDHPNRVSSTRDGIKK